MERPNIEDYVLGEGKYSQALEKYCDWFEKNNAGVAVVSKRFSFHDFMIGLMVGVLASIIIVASTI